MRIIQTVALSLALAPMLVACSGSHFDGTITDISATTTGDASTSEGPPNGYSPPGAPPSDCAPNACPLPSSPGFALVLFGDPAQTCPADFIAADVIESPTPRPEACTCGACSANVDCSSGSIASYYDRGKGDCGTRGAPLDANHGACQNKSGKLGENASVDAPKAVVGSCSAQGVASRDSVATRQKRLCKPAPSTCPDRACAAPSGMQACLVKKGDANCPASTPTKHLVGSDFTLRCDDCECTMDATCAGTLRLYSKDGCHGSSKTLRAGECKETNGDDFESTRWTGKVATTRCAKQPAPAPVVALEDRRTVCCP